MINSYVRQLVCSPLGGTGIWAVIQHSRDRYCADSGLQIIARAQDGSSLPVFWLQLCTVMVSKDPSSIFINSLWFKEEL